MRNILRIGILFFLIVVVVFILVKTFRVKPDKAKYMDELVNDISLQKMEKNIKEQVAIHKKYLMQLKGLNSEIKALGSKIEDKIGVARGLGEIGDEYMKNNFYPLALEVYSMGLEVFPQDPILNYKRGLVLSNMAKGETQEKKKKLYEEANSLYDKALELNPRYSDPHYSKALLSLVAHEEGIEMPGGLTKALSEVEDFLNRSSSSTEGYFLKARIAYTQGNDSLAIQTYQTILNIASVGSEPYNQAKNNLAELGIR